MTDRVLYRCSNCGFPVVSIDDPVPVESPQPGWCCICDWLLENVEDPAERAELLDEWNREYGPPRAN